MEIPLPAWAERYSSGSYTEVGTQLCTRDGRKIGNAVLIDARDDDYYVIRTDIGNKVGLTLEEIKRYFYKPVYIVKEIQNEEVY